MTSWFILHPDSLKQKQITALAMHNTRSLAFCKFKLRIERLSLTEP
jgi:hypothetical protein